MLIDWDGSLSVGNEQIDRDHETLVGIINNLYNSVANNHGADVISNILSELSDYVGYHLCGAIITQSLLSILCNMPIS